MICHCGNKIKDTYWGGSYRHVCCHCGCCIENNIKELETDIPITSVNCQMKYMIARLEDGKNKIIHIDDAEKLIREDKAEWVMDLNNVRYLRMKPTK